MSSSMLSCRWVTGCWLAEPPKRQGPQALLGDDGRQSRTGYSLVRLRLLMYRQVAQPASNEGRT